MSLTHDVIIRIFEYLPLSQIWELQYLSKSLGKLMREYKWNKTFNFKKDITDDELIEIIKNWNINKLDLSFCKQITNKSVKKLINIQKLSIHHCNNITYDSIKKLKMLKKIVFDNQLNINNLYKLNNNGVRIIQYDIFGWHLLR